MMPEAPPVEVRVWDLPVRLVHWAIVVLFAFQAVTAYLGGEMMQWHAMSGYTILTLVVFRILWGFAGSTYARFREFVRGPAEVLRFLPQLLTRKPVPAIGHNPLGGWNVVALLVVLLMQGLSGLFANDGADFEGPLAKLVSFDASWYLSHFHRWNVKLLAVLAGVHVIAVVLHWLVKGENLTGAMFTGRKRVPGAPVPPATFPGPWVSGSLLAAAVLFVYLLVGLPT